MNKILYTKGFKTVVEVDDLVFDGNHLVVPSYWTSSILDYIDKFDTTLISEADTNDFENFRNFLKAVEDFKNKNIN